MKPIIYTTPTWMYCHALMEWFNQNGIEYITRDLKDPTAAFEAEKLLGYPVTTVPTTVIGKEVIVGFNRSKIKRALRNATR